MSFAVPTDPDDLAAELDRLDQLADTGRLSDAAAWRRHQLHRYLHGDDADDQ